jgi:hypothetical protein
VDSSVAASVPQPTLEAHSSEVLPAASSTLVLLPSVVSLRVSHRDSLAHHHHAVVLHQVTHTAQRNTAQRHTDMAGRHEE